ncbi:BREX-2 system adenine-specific DNA-methyltransferase PglX [Nonomuraea sp. NBC_00507]|uniref:BREX-2 system adenine-specific DNA-methyltransferase PglX n=1 Tax=Nonomuraea sp. NBC_00507 TaxID=2976002 RepID=UPI002E18CAA7
MSVVSEDLKSDLQRQAQLMVDDLRTQAAHLPELKARLNEMYAAARAAKRTGDGPISWLDDQCERASSSWLIACAFIRFCEDNGLSGPRRWIASRDTSGRATSEAADAQEAWITTNPRLNAREWLREAFRWLRGTRAGRDLLPDTDFVWWWDISADRADALLEAFRRRDEHGERLVHDYFYSADLDTRFLGDLYQDLSAFIRDKYALFQTPVFVEELILDKTLTPAMEQFNLTELKLIDPTCGSGHFLLGAFARLLEEWRRVEPGSDPRIRVQKALDSIFGVDLNPAAAAITKFRLMVASLEACKTYRLDDPNTPALKISVATGDSLLYGGRRGRQTELNIDTVKSSKELEEDDALRYHQYAWENLDSIPGILDYDRYHVVVGNPPYVQVKNKTLNRAYRDFYDYCSGRYALSVPFMELFFRLAIMDAAYPGYVGLITANNFMKREFGKKLIEEFLAPKVDLTHVIDTSGAYIPHHGTPTVILLGRNRDRNRRSDVRAVLGVRGEPSKPVDASQGKVWRSILEAIDLGPNDLPFDTPYVTVVDLKRAHFAKHPWSLSGGGAPDLMELLLKNTQSRLIDVVAAVGITAVTGEDELYLLPNAGAARRLGIDNTMPLVEGDAVRDFAITDSITAIWTYDEAFGVIGINDLASTGKILRTYRTAISHRKRFGTPMLQRGLTWWEWQELYTGKLSTPLTITFAEVATHNHFVLDRGGKVFKQTAPVIKLKAEASEDDHLPLLGLLNSSTACFWLKEVCHNKGSSVDRQGARQTTIAWENFYQFNSTKVRDYPIPREFSLLYEAAKTLDRIARRLATVTPEAVCAGGIPSRQALNAARDLYEAAHAQMVSVQEELDWQVYKLYGILDEDLTYDGDDLPGLALGERAFEILLARQVEDGEAERTWFDRHGSIMRTDLPAEWPQTYKDLVCRRIDFIANKPLLHLVERPECKRRWAAEPYEKVRADALRGWLLDRLEASHLWLHRDGSPRALSVAQLADLLRLDDDFRQVLDLYVGTPDHDLVGPLDALLATDAVPFLAAYRYTDSGLRKRAEWEHIWTLQREEDAWLAAHAAHQERWLKEQVPIPRSGPGSDAERPAPIPIPPKYGSGDFKAGFWRHRGKVDVPKERFIAYPGAERDGDTSAVYGWAGWDHLQQATALANIITTRGFGDERVVPLLAGLAELEPWLHQWHGEYDPNNGDVPAEYFSDWLRARLTEHGLTRAQLAAWRPTTATRGAKKTSKKTSALKNTEMRN